MGWWACVTSPTQTNSGVGAEAMPRNTHLARTLVGVTTRSDAAGLAARSQFFFAMVVAADSIQMYLSLFQALFAAVAVAFIVFFIKPTHVDPRFGLPVGGFFAAVGNNIFVSSQLPASDRVSLANLTSAFGLVTIFLSWSSRRCRCTSSGPWVRNDCRGSSTGFLRRPVARIRRRRPCPAAGRRRVVSASIWIDAMVRARWFAP